MKFQTLLFSAWILACALCSIRVSAAPVLSSAKVSDIQNDVRISEQQKQRAASVGDVVEGERTLMTGKKSRAELVFNDQSVARLGANSVFSFKPGSRDVNLQSGFLLLHTPKGQGGAQINTPSASASILGTTILVGALPGGGMKLAVLEGTARVDAGKEHRILQAGQLAFLTKENGLSPAINVDLQKLVGSSALIQGFHHKIGSEDLIKKAMDEQANLKSEGELKESGYQIATEDSSWWDDWAYWFALEALLDLFLEETDSEGEDLSGAVQIFPTDVIDHSGPTINDFFGPYLTGSYQGGGIIEFADDRFYFSGNFPASINDGGTSVLRFHASGASVNYTTSFNAIILDNLTGTINGNWRMEFYADRGGIKSIYTDLIHAGPIEMHTFGTYPDEGHIDIWNTVIDTRNGASSINTPIDLVSDGDAVFVDGGSKLITGDLVNEAYGSHIGIVAPDTYGFIYINDSVLQTGGKFGSGDIQVDALGAQGEIQIANSVLTTTAGLGAIAQPINIRTDVNNGIITLSNVSITAGNLAGYSAPVNIVGKYITLTNVKIEGSTVSIGNPGNNAVIKFVGAGNVIKTDSGTASIQGTQTGSVTITVH